MSTLRTRRRRAAGLGDAPVFHHPEFACDLARDDSPTYMAVPPLKRIGKKRTRSRAIHQQALVREPHYHPAIGYRGLEPCRGALHETHSNDASSA